MIQLQKIENKFVITLFSFILLSIIGFIDYSTGSEVSLLLAYLIPILLISFYDKSEKKLLFVNALFAAFVWFVADFNTRDYSNLFNPIWNAAVRFSVFIIIGLLVLNIREKYKKVIKLNEELQKLNEEKNKFIGVAAHDLRNPIGAIFSFSDLLLEDYSNKIDPKATKMLLYIKELSNNALDLLKNLLDISKIESGTIELSPQYQDYIAFTKKLMDFNLLIAKKKNISMQLETTENSLFFNFDENYLSEVINNLLTNAIKFSYQNSNILIRISATNKNTVKTEVIDEGQGIQKEEQANLFNYFQKTSTQPTDGEQSSGLGLAIAKKIIIEHKGSLGLISELGKGSNFFFELPIV
ncbi:MAG: HAMP domain-containing histidine kinase [Gelidibacter sp.]|nr:HAMP domain-containing histidine kinase [Gelidibacter sp.]